MELDKMGRDEMFYRISHINIPVIGKKDDVSLFIFFFF